MNTRLMAEALIYCGQKCTVNNYEMNVNGIRLIIKDNTISSDSGKTSFHGAGITVWYNPNHSLQNDEKT